MHPAEEKARLELVREGLKRFADAVPLTLREVFGVHANPKYRNMERKVLTLLTERGVISKIPQGKVGEPDRFVLKNARELVSIVEDDIELSEVVWPSAPAEAYIETQEPQQLEMPAPSTSEVPPPFIPPEAPPTVEELMAGVLDRFSAIAEVLHSMDKRLESIDKKVSKIYKDLES